MKNIALAFVFFFTLAGSTFAHVGPTSKAKAATIDRALIQALSLSESQYIKLKALERTKAQELKDVQAVATAETMDAFVAEINERFDTALLQLLNPTQKNAYVTSKRAATK